MSEKKPGPSLGFEQMVLAILVLGGMGAFFQTMLPLLESFWHHHIHVIHAVLWLIVAAAPVAIIVVGWNIYVKRKQDQSITGEDDNAVYLGKEKATGQKVYLRQDFRTLHTQIIGSTGCGKSESTVIPMAVHDIANGSGLLLIDGKPDGRFIDKLYSNVKKYDREKDFKVFSLGNIAASSSFNPLNGDNPQQVTERVFSSFKFDNEYFRNVQYKYFLGIMRLIFEQKEVPTFALVKQLLSDMDQLKIWIEASRDDALKNDMTIFANLSLREREERVSGLEASISNFVSGDLGCLFEETDDRIDLDEAMEKNQIIYFQLPTMLNPYLASATGKLVLQAFQSAIAKRQLKMKGGTGDESDVLRLRA